MTCHEGEPTDEAFAAFREPRSSRSSSPGKLRGVLLQYHPRFVKSRRGEGRARPSARHGSNRSCRSSSSAIAPGWIPTSAPTRSGSWKSRGSPYVSVDAPLTRATNVAPRVAAATHPVAVIRFHGRNAQTWNIRGGSAADRFDWMYSDEELAEWIGPTRRLAEQADEVYALFNNNRDDFAPRSAVIFRGLLDEAGMAATGGIDLPPAEMTLF